MMIVSLLELGRHTWIQKVSRQGSVCVSLLGCTILEHGVVLVFDKAMFWSFQLCVSKIELSNKLLNCLVCFLYQLGFTRGL